MNNSKLFKLKRRNPSHKNTLIYLKSAKILKCKNILGLKIRFLKNLKSNYASK